jgi:metalloendopeptidase OMA1, mitochondrial
MNRFFRLKFRLNQFQRNNSSLEYFNTRPNERPNFRMNKFWFGLLGIGVVYYVTHQDYAPISNRRRFIALSREYEASLGQLELRNILQQYQKYILPSFHPIAQKISKITHSIIQISGLQDLKWEVYVIDYPLQNAFVLPGGKVFFFTGILNAADTDDRIAAVLGHEVIII